jgi:hypothetical protein
MTVMVPTVFAVRCGLPGNVAVKWASLAVSTYAEAEPGEDVGAARNATAAAIQPANSKIPTTIGQRISLGGV